MGTYKRRPVLLTLVTSYEDCPVDLPKQQYLEITEGFMKFIADKIVEGEEVNLPLSMGTIMITGRKQQIKTGENGEIRGLAPDWKSTLALWKKDEDAKEKKKMIYHFNEHSRGIRYKFSWHTQNVSLRMKNVFSFYATREHKRKVWKSVCGGKEYRIFKKTKRVTA